MYMKKNSLKTLLSPEEYKIADSITKEKLGTGLAMFNKMKPFFLMSTIMQTGFAKDMDLTLDLYFLNKAREQEKPCFGVEKFMDQINAIDAIGEEEQAQLFFEFITDTTSSMDKEIDELITAYLNFDLEKLSELMEEADNSMKDFEKNFLIKRNKVMVSNFIKTTKKYSCFCAIGAAHLSGKDGLIDLLRKKGYTVEPIIFTWENTSN